MKVCVVVPNWNGSSVITTCIDSLLNQSIPITIIVVDNGSIDDSLQLLEAYGTKIILIKNSHNLGFAGGVNTGIVYALKHDFTFIALFNNDAIANDDWAEELVKAIKSDESVGIVTSKFMRMDKMSLDSTGDFYTIYGLPFPRGRDELDSGQYDNSTTVFGASGGASLYRSSMLSDIGLFDEDFFAYFEDVDMSFRAQLANWKVLYAPTAVAYHHVSATSSKLGHFSVYQTAKNFPILYLKNMPGILFWKYLPYATYWYIRMFGARIVRGGGWAYFTGMTQSLILTPRKLMERHKIQKRRSVPIDYIDSNLYHKRPPVLGEKFDG